MGDSKERRTESRDSSSSGSGSNSSSITLDASTRENKERRKGSRDKGSSGIGSNSSSSTGEQQEKEPEQEEIKNNNNKNKTEEPTRREVAAEAEKTVLQELFNNLQIDRDKLWKRAEGLRKPVADLRAVKTSMGTDWESAGEVLKEELEWLWTQVAKFARHDKVNHTVLMVIEPEPSKGS